jgi:hypothetical protein
LPKDDDSDVNALLALDVSLILGALVAILTYKYSREWAPVILSTFCGMLFSVMALKAFRIEEMQLKVAILVGVSYSFLVLSKKYHLLIVIITSSFFGSILLLLGIGSMQRQLPQVEISPTTIAYMLALQVLTAFGVFVQLCIFRRTQRRVRQRLQN